MLQGHHAHQPQHENTTHSLSHCPVSNGLACVTYLKVATRYPTPKSPRLLSYTSAKCQVCQVQVSRIHVALSRISALHPQSPATQGHKITSPFSYRCVSINIVKILTPRLQSGSVTKSLTHYVLSTEV